MRPKAERAFRLFDEMLRDISDLRYEVQDAKVTGGQSEREKLECLLFTIEEIEWYLRDVNDAIGEGIYEAHRADELERRSFDPGVASRDPDHCVLSVY